MNGLLVAIVLIVSFLLLLVLAACRVSAEADAQAEEAFQKMMEGAVSKWLKQAMRGSAFFRNIFGQAKTECRKNGTQRIIFIRNSKWNEL